MLWKIAFPLVVLASLTACSTLPKETIPSVHLAQNTSGIQIKEIKKHGPEIMHIPDYRIPSRVSLRLRFLQPERSGWMDIVSIENPGEYHQGYLEYPALIAQWKEILNGEKNLKYLPYLEKVVHIPMVNAARMFHGKMRLRTYPWGKAVLFLATYANGKKGGVVSNECLTFVVQGITHDGRYAVLGFFAITHPKLPDSDDGEKGKINFDFDYDSALAERWLDNQPDDSFRPTLAQFEAFLQALEIKPPERR